jgi:cytochrome c-type biogenesis protein CcmF
MDYIGEHLFPGQLGHFLVVLSLVASLVATIAYFKSTTALTDEVAGSWKRMARIAFIIDALSIAITFGIIYHLISNHYFEYYYAWNHSDKSLKTGYLFASIWEGQEGSFLLWAFWHGVLGIILMRTSKKWEAPVMTVLSFAQLYMATMVLGIHFFDIKLGSSPFLLTRYMQPAFMDMANYLTLPVFRDGNGLNQLLQNYWMQIHPPIIFLGYASTVVPFSYAIAGLWKKEHSTWTKPVMPWALFSAAILGLGIMMGARWAYESLNFGGYWAWDPVENASMVPWLVMVAGIHTVLIYNSTGHSLRSSYLFLLLGFPLILYSNYLTKSGDLADTSVHAFTSQGLNWQLRIGVLLFIIPALAFFAKRYKQIPAIVKEENTYSREFWMFIGSLILFLCSLFIVIFTSLPVINKIFNTNFNIGTEVEFFYNRIVIFVAIVLGVLTALTQFLKYKNTKKSEFGKKIILPTVLSLLIGGAISYWGNINYDTYGIGFLAAIHLAIFAGVYTAVSNAAYIWTGLKGKLKVAGASVGHIGFGVFLVGILISSSKKEILSVNRTNPLNFGEGNKITGTGMENLTLYHGVKNDMGEYYATYVADSSINNGRQIYFHIEMEKKDGSDKFTLYPDLMRNTKGDQGISNNPDAKHYWNRDIFTYINHSSKLQEGEDTASFVSTSVMPGDTIFYSNGFMILDKVTLNPNNARYKFTEKDTAIMAEITVYASNGRKLKANPVYQLTNNQVKYTIDTVFAEGLAVGLSRVADAQRIEISVKDSTKLVPFVALKVLRFPFINLVWLGTILMIVGFVMSISRRVRLLR